MNTHAYSSASGTGFAPAPEARSFLASLALGPAQDLMKGPLRIKAVEEQLLALRTSLVCAFNQLLDLKDLNTGVHSTRLAEWALHVAGDLGLDDSTLADIEVAALLHDIGKIGIPDAVLDRKSTRLNSSHH